MPDLPLTAAPADGIVLRRWFAAYALWLAAAGGLLAALIHGSSWSWSQWLHQPARTFTETHLAVKLLGFVLYLSLCCTFLPLPTAWIVAAVATREAAVTGELISTVAVVALAGAIGSTLANLNDYYLFTALLRRRRVAAVRNTRTYRAAIRWFAKAPFWIMLIFNVVPVPVDVVRMLAAAHRYNRAAFAAANFVGRLLRYAVIVFATYYWNLGWIAPVTLLALAVALGAARLLGGLARKRTSDESRMASLSSEARRLVRRSLREDGSFGEGGAKEDRESQTNAGE